jgi:hypothetical protein
MTLTSPKIVTSILDTNANTLLGITATGTAVNSLTLANAAAGGSPSLSAVGTNADIGITIAAKANGNVIIRSSPTGTNRNRAIFDCSSAGSNVASEFSWQKGATQYWSLGNDAATTGTQDFYLYDTVGSAIRFYVTSTKVELSSGAIFGWPASNTFPAAAIDTGLARGSAGVIQANNGTAGSGGIFDAGTGYRIANAAASGKILKGDGTNFVASTETYAAPGTTGHEFRSDGTNWVSAASNSSIRLYVTGITVLTAGSPADIATIAVPSWITRWCAPTTAAFGNVLVYASAASGTLAGASFTFQSASGGGGTALNAGLPGPAAVNQVNAAGTTNANLTFTSSTIYVRQTANSANAGTCSFYIEITPIL